MHPEATGQWIIDVIDQALQGIDIVERALPGLLRQWADNLSTFGTAWPDWAKDSAYYAGMALVTAQLGILRDTYKLLREMVLGWGLPTVLRNEAQRIDEGLGRILKDLDTEIRVEALNGLNSETWDSAAAAKYLTAFHDQDEQLDDLEKVADALVRVLRDSASSQDDFYADNLFNIIGTAFGVAGLVLSIVGLVGSVAAGAGVPVAIAGLVIGIIGILLNIIGFALAGQGSTDRAAVLSGVLDAAPINAWPRSTFAT